MPIPLAQASGPSAATLFYITLLIIFITAIITTVVAKWSRDKCLKFFRGYRITMERYRGATETQVHPIRPVVGELGAPE